MHHPGGRKCLGCSRQGGIEEKEKEARREKKKKWARATLRTRERSLGEGKHHVGHSDAHERTDCGNFSTPRDALAVGFEQRECRLFFKSRSKGETRGSIAAPRRGKKRKAKNPMRLSKKNLPRRWGSYQKVQEEWRQRQKTNSLKARREEYVMKGESKEGTAGRCFPPGKPSRFHRVESTQGGQLGVGRKKLQIITTRRRATPMMTRFRKDVGEHDSWVSGRKKSKKKIFIKELRILKEEGTSNSATKNRWVGFVCRDKSKRSKQEGKKPTINWKGKKLDRIKTTGLPWTEQ